jgi:UDP-4-amino-4,6-dideoxy-N-acetyl-beta-L-altrosamine N-acetyltransferase
MFEYNGLKIRVVEENDLEHIRILRNNPSTWMMLTDIAMIDAEVQRQWFQRIRVANDRRYYVICDDSCDFIGIVRTDEIDLVNRSIRVGADILPELRGRGYGNKVYGLLKKYCFDFLNMHRVWLAVLSTNKKSVKLYKQQGFRVDGRYREAIFRDGAYRDYIIMSILEHEYRREKKGKDR